MIPTTFINRKVRNVSIYKSHLNCNLKIAHLRCIRGCLHDTGTSFILVRVHPGSCTGSKFS